MHVGQFDERDELIDVRQDVFRCLRVIDAGVADAHQQIGHENGLGTVPGIHCALLRGQEHRLVITAPYGFADMEGFLHVQVAQAHFVPHQRTRQVRKLALVFRTRADRVCGLHGRRGIVKGLALRIGPCPLADFTTRQTTGLPI